MNLELKCADIRKTIPKNKKRIAQSFLRLKNPKTDINKPKIKTINIVETNKIFRPRPTGNILTKGVMIKTTGTPKRAKRIRFGTFCLMSKKKLNNPKNTGIIKKLAPFNSTATKAQIKIQKNKGATSKFAGYLGVDNLW